MTQNKPQFSWSFTALTLVLVVLMSSLGAWQLDRAELKTQRMSAFETGRVVQDASLQNMPPRYSEIELSGRFDSARQIIMDGFSVDKRPGFQVLTPFVVEDENLLLMVNRGWRVWTGERRAVANMEVDPELRTIRGRVERFWAPGMVLGEGNASEERRWPRIVVYPQHDEISQWMQQPVANWQLLLDPEDEAGFSRDWRPTGLSPERHFGYAMQWFALAITLLILYGIVTFKRTYSSKDSA